MPLFFPYSHFLQATGLVACCNIFSWRRLRGSFSVDPVVAGSSPVGLAMTDDDRRNQAENDLYESLVILGDAVAKHRKYRVHRGLDALHFYLIETHHWTPSVIRSLSIGDIASLTSEIAEEVL